MSKDKKKYEELFSELENYEKNGVDILMEGCKVSPMQIITECMIKEAVSYTHLDVYKRQVLL